MLKDLYRCSPLPWLITALVFAIVIWAGPFLASSGMEGVGAFGFSHSVKQTLSLFLIILNVFLFRKFIDMTSILKTGERLSMYPLILLSSLCLVGMNGIIELLAISLQLLVLIRTFNGIATGSLGRAAFDSGLIMAFASLLNPVYAFLLIIFIAIAFIHAMLNIKVLLISLIGLAVPFLIYSQVAYLLEFPMIPAVMIRERGSMPATSQGNLFLIFFLLVLIGVLLYNLYLSFSVMGTGQVRRRMLIRSGFSMLGITIALGFLSSLTGYGPSPHLAMIPGLCILCLEFMKNHKSKWESYLFLAWAGMTLAFVWLAS
jgi:hypothetical protein